MSFFTLTEGCGSGQLRTDPCVFGGVALMPEGKLPPMLWFHGTSGRARTSAGVIQLSGFHLQPNRPEMITQLIGGEHLQRP